jgi:hypothetical protein
VETVPESYTVKPHKHDLTGDFDGDDFHIE